MSFLIGTEENARRDEICFAARSMFERGYTSGSTGNISVRLSDGTLLMTPSNASLGNLDPVRLSHVDADGNRLGGDIPTKEAFLHLSMYRRRAGAGAVVHLHAPHSVAVSLLVDAAFDDVLPPLTAYYVMRVGHLPLLPYFAPGDVRLAEAVDELAARHHAILLANHGPLVAGTCLADAQHSIEELEETARLYLLVRDRKFRVLTDEQIVQLNIRFGEAGARTATATKA